MSLTAKQAADCVLQVFVIVLFLMTCAVIFVGSCLLMSPE